ncbi:MAG: hypothetical protein LBP92_13890 [Deltaproteobacteria bacterium]|jgi:hypothetical protein|nr:hypothetical protein [Deltaproteobacteria bacterium]
MDLEAHPLDEDAEAEIETVVLDDIDLPASLERLDGPLPYDSRHLRRVAGSLLNEAMVIAKPRAAFRLSLIRDEGEDRIEIGPVVLESPVLTKNLRGLGRAFPFLATEGPELAGWAASLAPRDRTAAFVIRYLALKEAERRLEERLSVEYGVSGMGAMSPGVLPAWPLSGQGPLFELLRPLPEELGVSLKGDSFWMSPDVSSSGLYFETEAGFHNCRLCPLDRCPLRRFVRDGQENGPLDGDLRGLGA